VIYFIKYVGGTIYVLRGFLLPKPIQKLGGIPKLRIALAEVCSLVVCCSILE
jgi:hypothetical protein